MGITILAKGDIRYAWSFLRLDRSVLIAAGSRLARRGGIKRLSGTIYDATRDAMIDRLKTVCPYLFRVERLPGLMFAARSSGNA